jgi:hypothetical protein
MIYNIELGFKIGHLVHPIIDTKTNKEKIYKIISFEVEEGGNWHDGHEETHYVILEDMNTHEIKKYKLAFLNLMCNIRIFYFVKFIEEQNHQVSL